METKDPMGIESEQLFSLGMHIDPPYIVDVLMFEVSFIFRIMAGKFLLVLCNSMNESSG